MKNERVGIALGAKATLMLTVHVCLTILIKKTPHNPGISAEWNLKNLNKVMYGPSVSGVHLVVRDRNSQSGLRRVPLMPLIQKMNGAQRENVPEQQHIEQEVL